MIKPKSNAAPCLVSGATFLTILRDFYMVIRWINIINKYNKYKYSPFYCGGGNERQKLHLQQ
jgi:hypothetical protein